MCTKTALPCPLCCQSNFPSVDSLKTSLLSVTRRPLTCPICNETLLGLDKLTIHLFAHSINSASTEDSTENPIHEKVPKEVQAPAEPPPPPLIPNLIPIPFDNQETPIQIELSPLQQPNAAPSGCEICGLTFADENLLSIHNKLVHPPPTDGQQASKFRCHLCCKSFKMRGSLRIHLRVAHVGLSLRNIKLRGHEGQESPPELPPLSLAEEQSPPPPPPSTAATHHVEPKSVTTAPSAANNDNSCDICAKTFTTKYFLKKHKRLHTGEMPYACFCGKTFTFQQSYHKHLLYHSDEKPHTCAICSRSFKELSTLHNHERIHSGEKPFKCETCGKCFRQRVSYLVHRRIHTGVMPYRCTACNKSFRYKVSQRTHKCSAQPPGTVVRQPGDLLQRLLHSISLFPATEPPRLEEETIEDSLQDPINSSATAAVDDHISQTLDQLLQESYQQLGISEESNFLSIEPTTTTTTTTSTAPPPPPAPPVANMSQTSGENVPSPTEGIQNLCLMSPISVDAFNFANEFEATINEESFKQLLYDRF